MLSAENFKTNPPNVSSIETVNNWLGYHISNTCTKPLISKTKTELDLKNCGPKNFQAKKFFGANFIANLEFISNFISNLGKLEKEFDPFTDLPRNEQFFCIETHQAHFTQNKNVDS